MGDLSPGIPDAWICLANPNVQFNTNMSLIRFKDDLGVWSAVCLGDYFTLLPGGPFPIYDETGVEKYNIFYMLSALDDLECCVLRREDKKKIIFDWPRYNTNPVRFAGYLAGKLDMNHPTIKYTKDNYATLLQLGPDVIVEGKKLELSMRSCKPQMRWLFEDKLAVDDNLGFMMRDGVVKSFEQISLNGFGDGSESWFEYNKDSEHIQEASVTKGIFPILFDGTQFDDYFSGSILILPSNTLYLDNVVFEYKILNDFLSYSDSAPVPRSWCLLYKDPPDMGGSGNVLMRSYGYWSKIEQEPNGIINLYGRDPAWKKEDILTVTFSITIGQRGATDLSYTAQFVPVYWSGEIMSDVTVNYGNIISHSVAFIMTVIADQPEGQSDPVVRFTVKSGATTISPEFLVVSIFITHHGPLSFAKERRVAPSIDMETTMNNYFQFFPNSIPTQPRANLVQIITDYIASNQGRDFGFGKIPEIDNLLGGRSPKIIKDLEFYY